MSSPILAVLYSERIVKKIQNIILALSTCVAAPSYAADLIIEAPAIIESDAYDWSGFYAGVVGGYGAGPTLAGSTNLYPMGALVGATAGYNHQIDGFVLGAEGELLWSGVGGTAICANPTYSCAGNLTWLSSVRGRAGLAIDSLLLYATLGLAAGGVTATTNPAPPSSTGSFSGTAYGWTAGAGAEVAVTETISVKAEYAYYNLTTQAPINTIANLGASDINGQLHTVKVGINFAF